MGRDTPGASGRKGDSQLTLHCHTGVQWIRWLEPVRSYHWDITWSLQWFWPRRLTIKVGGRGLDPRRSGQFLPLTYDTHFRADCRGVSSGTPLCSSSQVKVHSSAIQKRPTMQFRENRLTTYSRPAVTLCTLSYTLQRSTHTKRLKQMYVRKHVCMYVWKLVIKMVSKIKG